MFKTIFLKEMKDVLRDKRSITLLVLLPLLTMMALTIFYDKILASNSDKSFQVGVEKAADREFIDQLETYLPDATIKEYADVQKAVEEKEAQIGISIDFAWNEKLKKKEKIPVHIYFDPGSQESSNAWSLVQTVFSNWQNETVQLRLQEQQLDPSVLEVFQIETKTTKDEDDAIASFMLSILIPLLIPIAIANGSYPSATELFAGEKEKKTIEALLITPVKPIKILLAKWLTISLLGIFTGLLCIGLLSLLMNFTTELKKGLGALEHPLLFVSMSVVIIVLFSIFMAEVEMILSMLAKSVKEAGYYITPVMGLMTLPMLFMFFTNESLNLALYSIPFMNLFIFVRDAFTGQLTVAAFLIAVGCYVVIIGLLFPVALKMFHNHRLMLGK